VIFNIINDSRLLILIDHFYLTIKSAKGLLMETQDKTSQSFDVFLSHNSLDKPIVRELAQALSGRGLRVWVDDEQLVPGRSWQDKLEDIIQSTRSAAVLVGQDGLGPWETVEMRTCLSEFVRRGMPVIPVLLPDAPKNLELPPFLNGFTRIDMRNGLNGLNKDALDKMVWGITGVKPVRKNTGCYILLTESDEFSARICNELSKQLNKDFIKAPDPKDNVGDYRQHVRTFLDSSAKWLITISHADQVDFFIEVFESLDQNADKKFIFFESGRDLVEAWRERKPGTLPPIVVLETKHEVAAKRLLENISKCLPDGVQRIAVVMLIPAVYPGNLRAKVYQRYLGVALSGESRNMPTWIDAKEIEVFKWHIKEWPKEEKDVEVIISQHEKSMMAAMDADAAVFLCGNDKIARGVRSALVKKKSTRMIRSSWNAKPILVGFDDLPENQKYFGDSGFTLLTAEIKLEFWCQDVAKLIHDETVIPESNAILSVAILRIFQ